MNEKVNLIFTQEMIMQMERELQAGNDLRIQNTKNGYRIISDRVKVLHSVDRGKRIK